MTRRAIPTHAKLFALALALLLIAVVEGLSQKRDDDFIRSQAREALRAVSTDNFDEKLTALRDYVRARVRNVDFPARGRPFLRDTAADTLRTGRGRCGEATRAFVNLARASGISAQRLYLDGPRPHVLAVARTVDGRKLVVDAYASPYVPETEPLERLLSHPEFTSYSTLGFRRMWPLRALPSHELGLGPLNYLFENPHALASLFWLAASAVALALAEVMRRRERRAAPENFKKELTAEPV
ncbi:MAG TPA: transglutaminase domain-containing protein [Pyrinomonadaceae bacterium]|nr:transglutaminase domain-containing protein [Pyrinomonadaceae bacterium]